LDDYNKKSNSAYRQGLVRIKEVKSQVVAGEMFYITFYTGQTTCKNDKAASAPKNCPLAKGGDADNSFQLCEAEIWEKPWQNFRELQQMHCKKATRQEAQT